MTVLIAESPSFAESPEPTLTVAEGQSAVFTCNVDGAPKPSLMWLKGEMLTDVHDLHDRRITVLPNGNLRMEVSQLSAFHSMFYFHCALTWHSYCARPDSMSGGLV